MNVAFEEQNAVLQRHTQSMSSARERLEQELALEERRTLALQQQLQAVRQALTTSFASLPVPGAQPRPQLRPRPHNVSLSGPAPVPRQAPPRRPIRRTGARPQNAPSLRVRTRPLARPIPWPRPAPGLGPAPY